MAREDIGGAAVGIRLDGLRRSGDCLLKILAIVIKSGLGQETLQGIDFRVAGVELDGFLKILPGFFLLAEMDPGALHDCGSVGATFG